MEASAAGLAASGDGGQDGGGGSEQQNGQPDGGGSEISQLAEQLAGLSSGQEEMRGQFQDFLSQVAEQQQQQQQGGEEAPDEQPLPDLSVFDDTQAGYDQKAAAEALQQLVQSEAESMVEKAVGPLQSRIDDVQRERETDLLISEFPDLGKSEVAEKVVGEAQQHAAVLGQPELVQNPQFLKMVYMAGRAAELGQRQSDGAADGAAATLEGAGGASPAGAGQGENQADQIRESWSQRGNVLAKL